MFQLFWMRECVNVMDEAVNVSSVTSMRFNLIRAVSSNEWLIVLSEMGLWLSCLNAVFLLGDVTVVKIVFLLIEVSIVFELKVNMLLRLIRDCAGYNQHVDSVWELGGQCSVLESYHW